MGNIALCALLNLSCPGVALGYSSLRAGWLGPDLGSPDVRVDYSSYRADYILPYFS